VKPKESLQRLEQDCREKGVRLIYDELQSEGGLCRLRDRYYIIINRHAAIETRVRIINDALSKVQKKSNQPIVQAQEMKSDVVFARIGGPDTNRE